MALLILGRAHYEMPSAAPMSPNGPAGSPHPVVLSVKSDHHMTGCEASPRTLAASVACCCGAVEHEMAVERGGPAEGRRRNGGAVA